MGRGGKTDEMLVEIERGFSESLLDELAREPVPRVKIQWQEGGREPVPRMNMASSGGCLRIAGRFTVENGTHRGKEALLSMDVSADDPVYTSACRALLGQLPEEVAPTDLLNAIAHKESHRVELEELSWDGESWLQIKGFIG